MKAMMTDTTALQLRQVRLLDLRILLRLEKEIFPEDAYGWREFYALFRRGRDTFLVATQGDLLIGYAAAFMIESEGYIASFGVVASARRQGHGRQILDAITQKLRAQGATSLGLHVRVKNTPALAFYYKTGFQISARISGYYADGMDAYYMTRPSDTPTAKFRTPLDRQG